MAGDQQQRTEGDGLARAEIAIREEAADQRHEIDERSIGAILALREVIAEQEMLGKIENEQRAHAVIGKALPHLGEE